MTEDLHGISGNDNRAQQKHMSSAQDVCESKEPMQRSAATADYAEDPLPIPTTPQMRVLCLMYVLPSHITHKKPLMTCRKMKLIISTLLALTLAL